MDKRLEDVDATVIDSDLITFYKENEQISGDMAVNIDNIHSEVSNVGSNHDNTVHRDHMIDDIKNNNNNNIQLHTALKNSNQKHITKCLTSEKDYYHDLMNQKNLKTNLFNKEKKLETKIGDTISAFDSSHKTTVQEKKDSDLCIRPLTSSSIQDMSEGLRAKPNTPANQNSITKQHNVRSGVFSSLSDRSHHGMTSGRTTQSSGAGFWEETIFSDQEQQFGIQTPRYFYIHQNKPSPMPPLPVWRGYKGNVYFQPISITRMSSAPHLFRRPPVRPYRLIRSSSQVYVLDKRAVVSVTSGGSRDELKSIELSESTGSLAVRPASAAPAVSAPKTSRASSGKAAPGSSAKQKIHKGSNFHSNKTLSSIPDVRAGARSAPLLNKQFFLGSSKSNRPPPGSKTSGLIIKGGKVPSSAYTHPIARSPTVLSFSTQRARVNTPDMSDDPEKFPALTSAELDTQEEVASVRTDVQSALSNQSEDRYTPVIQVRRLRSK